LFETLLNMTPVCTSIFAHVFEHVNNEFYMDQVIRTPCWTHAREDYSSDETHGFQSLSMWVVRMLWKLESPSDKHGLFITVGHM